MFSATSFGGQPLSRLCLYVRQARSASPARAHELRSSRQVVSSGSYPAARIRSAASNARRSSPARPDATASATYVPRVNANVTAGPGPADFDVVSVTRR